MSANNPWGIRFSTMFHISNDSHLFRTREQLEAEGWRLAGNVFEQGGERYLPLYEGRLGHQFNHRFATQPGGELKELNGSAVSDPFHYVEPQYWVKQQDTEAYFERRATSCCTGLLGFRRVARDTDERTCISAIIPWGAASYGWILTFGPNASDLELLCATYNSFVFDYLLRNSLSQPSIPQGTFEQLPALPPSTYTQPYPWFGNTGILRDWLLSRVLELTYTAWDLEPFARDCLMANSEWRTVSGEEDFVTYWQLYSPHSPLATDRTPNPPPPFRWDEARRFLLRCELDAAFFHLYGIARDDVDYIMKTFPIVKRKDEAKYGEYRTKRVILEIYDAMRQAMETGEPYQTLLDPPPADPRCCHPPR